MAILPTSGLNKDEELESSLFDTILKEDKIVEPIEQDKIVEPIEQDKIIEPIKQDKIPEETKEDELFGINKIEPTQIEPKDNRVIQAINEGFNIIEIQQSLVDNFQISEEEAKQTIIDEFQGTINADIADSSIEEVRQNLLIEHNFPEDIVERLLVNAEDPVEAKALTREEINQHLVPITPLSEETIVDEKSTEQLAIQAR